MRFVAPDEQRRTLALGTASERQATLVKLRIENLLAAKKHGVAIDPETAAWLAGIKLGLRERLVQYCLIDAPEGTSEPERPAETLGAFLTRYFASRPDVKSSTKVD